MDNMKISLKNYFSFFLLKVKDQNESNALTKFHKTLSSLKNDAKKREKL